MKEITDRYLTFEEELLVAVYFNNAEKLKWLIGMDYFKPQMITEPKQYGDVTIPIYWITLCYKYMLRYDDYTKQRKFVDEILSIWHDKFHLDTNEIIDLYSCCKPSKDVFYGSITWRLGSLEINDFTKSGARQIDFDLYLAVCEGNIHKVQECLDKGADPDVKITTPKGNVVSTLSLYRNDLNNSRKYYLWGKEERLWALSIESLVRKGREELIRFLLEKNSQNHTAKSVSKISTEISTSESVGDDFFWNAIGKRFYEKDNIESVGDDFFWNPKEKERIDTFIKEIDTPGAILTVFDEGKAFARCLYLDYQDLYWYVLKRVMTETQHVVIRIGGYSDRIESQVLEMVNEMPQKRIYVEHLSQESSNYEWENRDSRKRIIGMAKFDFKPDMEIVKKAEEYDFKSFGNKNGSHPMVYYYVNNIDTGWYDEEGKFCSFYSKERGLQAITDVIMIDGYQDIAPATAAICTFTFDSTGDTILSGSSIHNDHRSRTSSQRWLIEQAGIKLLDLTRKLQQNEM